MDIYAKDTPRTKKLLKRLADFKKKQKEQGELSDQEINRIKREPKVYSD